MKRWSKLQKELYKLMTDEINFQIHCIAYPMRSQYGSTNLPRYYISLNKEILWDYPKDFVLKNEETKNDEDQHKTYPYYNDVSDISELIREYIDTPKDEIFSKHFENDKWGLINILKSADRRIGKRRLQDLAKKIKNKSALKIIELRLKNGKK